MCVCCLPRHKCNVNINNTQCIWAIRNRIKSTTFQYRIMDGNTTSSRAATTQQSHLLIGFRLKYDGIQIEPTKNWITFSGAHQTTRNIIGCVVANVLINENRHKSSIDLHWSEWFNLIAVQSLNVKLLLTYGIYRKHHAALTAQRPYTHRSIVAGVRVSPLYRFVYDEKWYEMRLHWHHSDVAGDCCWWIVTFLDTIYTFIIQYWSIRLWSIKYVPLLHRPDSFNIAKHFNWYILRINSDETSHMTCLWNLIEIFEKNVNIHSVWCGVMHVKCCISIWNDVLALLFRTVWLNETI